MNEVESNVYRSEDAGESWHTVKGVPDGSMLEMTLHPYDNNRAFIISNENTHWKTKDRGATWQEFHTESQASLFRQALHFHAGDPDRILFNAMDCRGIFCEETVR